MSDRVNAYPTVEQLEARILELKEELEIAKGYLSVARRAARRRQEGPTLPGMADEPKGEPEV